MKGAKAEAWNSCSGDDNNEKKSLDEIIYSYYIRFISFINA
jgi:hypothetical protein